MPNKKNKPTDTCDWQIWQFPSKRIRHLFVGACKARGVDWKVTLVRLMKRWIKNVENGEDPRNA